MLVIWESGTVFLVRSGLQTAATSVPTMADYEALTRRLFFGNNNVKRFRTFVAMDRVKVGLAVPLPG